MNSLLKIPLVQKGKVFISRKRANDLIIRVNALIGLQVKRGSKDDFKISDANAILTIARQIESDTAAGDPLAVYKVTAVSDVALDYVLAKKVTFAADNSETLGDEVQVAIPWALRESVCFERTPEYAIDDYIVVAPCPSGSGVSPGDVAQIELIDLGIGRAPWPEVALYEITDISDLASDYFEAKLIYDDGATSTDGPTTNVAIAPELRGASGSIKRIPEYEVGDIVVVARCQPGTGIADAQKFVELGVGRMLCDVVYVKCCLADESFAYMPVIKVGDAYDANGGTTTPMTVTTGDVPDGETVLE